MAKTAAATNNANMLGEATQVIWGGIMMVYVSALSIYLAP